MADATVDIDAVEPEAIRIPTSDLRRTDIVFDVMGDQHALAWVRHHKYGVTFRRQDKPKGTSEWRSYRDWDGMTSTMTVIRRES